MLSTQCAPPGVDFLKKFCVECHGLSKPKARFSVEQLLAQPSIDSNAEAWEKISEKLANAEMPPADAEQIPSDAERRKMTEKVRAALLAYQTAHSGDPGRVTVRRLTSGEYSYAIRDLTSVDIPVGIDASNDSVGGEGFTNFGDVQSVQDSGLEHYLEAAKTVADHAIIGAGPLQFGPDVGRTGLELSALNRINDFHTSKGFRVVSGEGGRPFGLERYGQAFFVVWYFKNRALLGERDVTLRELAVREGITERFANHLWSVVNSTTLGYPTREMVERWKGLPSPTNHKTAAIKIARDGCANLSKFLTTWPSWFFARGDLAAGGAGDESPLVFNDTSLKVETKHHYNYPVGGRGRGATTFTPGAPVKIVLSVANINPIEGVHPVVVWRNARVVTRSIPPGTRNAGPAVAGAARRAPSGPVVSTHTLRSQLSAEIAETLAFGVAPDSTSLGPDDFACTTNISFELPAPGSGQSVELNVDAELGADRNAVVRVVISDRAEVPVRGAQTRAFLGDPASRGYQTFREGIAQYISLLPPNSHGEANPADKDPVPSPFDNTYNSPEHDAFVSKVKYQRADEFFSDKLVEGADRVRLEQAWNDLLGSWPYHDAYLGMLVDHYGLKLKSRRIQDLTRAEIAELPEAAGSQILALQTQYLDVIKAQKLAEPGHVDDAINFASRAWRRPLTPSEQSRFKAFYQRARSEQSMEHDDAIRALLARILVAPDFLYRVEVAPSQKDQPLSDWELASRLSFFLWSSIPDDELRRAAASGLLKNSTELARQVRRMTADAKARRLATEFFGQWLGFYRFDEFRGVDTSRFPEFTDDVKAAMYDQAVSTFEYLIRQQRPVKEVLNADYTFLNQALATFYGVGRPVGSTNAVVLVEGANAFNRGGALRLGAVLTATSAPLRTSPVKRGDWILRRILGTPTPPPPGDAGTLPGDPKTFGGLTLRQKLVEHKRNAACANCHQRIDPLGFPLEGFDAVGRTRTTYPDGQAIDLTGEFADERTIVGTEDLLQYLQAREGLVMKTLAKKMLGYALGRPVLATDRRLIDDLAATGSQASFGDLAIKIVNSRQFRYHQGQNDGENHARK